MATWSDVRQLALALPGAVEDTAGSTTAWRVGRRAFAWERLLRPGELRLLGDRAPDGPALGVRVPDLAARAALLAAHPAACFLVPPYEPFAMVLVHVARTPFEVLDELVTESWLDRAPKAVARSWLRAAGLPAEPA